MLRAALTGFIFGCLFLIGRRRGLIERDAALLTLVAFFVSAVALALRPQLLGMALFAAVLVLVTDRRAHPRRLWAVPVLVLVWANIHGSFFLGPVVLGLAWLEDVHDHVPRPHRALIVALVSVVASCVTPFGPGVWAYALGVSSNPTVTQRITEWQATSLHDVPGLLFFGSALAVVALIARRGERTSWPTLAWLGVFFVIGAYAIRGVAWWPLGAVAAIAGVLVTSRVPDPEHPRHSRDAADAPPQRRRRRRHRPRRRRAAAGVASARSGPSSTDWRRRDGAAGITAALRDVAGPGDHLFNPQPWGSWFEFELPDLPSPSIRGSRCSRRASGTPTRT